MHENYPHATGRSVVRGEWNFSGYILSDAGAAAFVGKTQIGHPGDPWHESNKSFGHGFASSPSDAAIKVSVGRATDRIGLEGKRIKCY